MNAPQNAPKNVLVCEDDPVQLRLFTALFEQAGYRSFAARTPAEALSMARRGRIDAVVTDVQLQDGNGFDLVGGLKRIGLDAPVIMATAYATEGMKERARSAGVRCFLEKPLDLGKIRRHVDQVIRDADRLQPRVIIVEGREDVRRGMEQAAGRAGFAVLAAAEGGRALEILRASTSPIDLLLMEFHASGTALIREALRLRPGLQVVMVTGEASREEIRAGYAAGAASLIRKPIRPKRLETFLKNSLFACRGSQRRVARRREREERRAAGPWTRKLARGLRRFRHRTAVAVGVASVLFGLTLAYGIGWGYEAVGRYEKLADAAIPLVRNSLEGSREDKAFSRWHLLEQLHLTRQAGEATRRFYDAQIQEMKWPRSSRNGPFQPGLDEPRLPDRLTDPKGREGLVH